MFRGSKHSQWHIVCELVAWARLAGHAIFRSGDSHVVHVLGHPAARARIDAGLRAVGAQENAPPKFDTVDLTYEKFELENGLTVVVHEDHKAPVVHVAVWYHIGSADEPTARPVSHTCSST